MQVAVQIAEQIDLRRSPDRVLVVGVSGPDAAGKTSFAEALRVALDPRFRVAVVHGDDFHYPRRHRYAGQDEVENYLQRSFNYDRLRERILEPAMREGRAEFDDWVMELATDGFTRRLTISAGPGDVLIVEGVFLFTAALRDYFDVRIFVTAPPEICMRRGVERDAPILGADALRRYREKYLPAQARHLYLDQPDGWAHVIVHNEDPRAPRVEAQAWPAS